jgi:hypothetical protein
MGDEMGEDISGEMAQGLDSQDESGSGLEESDSL